MIPPGSRYQNAEHRFTLAHVYTEKGYPQVEGNLGSTTLHVTVASRDTLYMGVPVTPTPPFEYYAKDGENMVVQAYRFLHDSRRWWEIAAANPQLWYPLDMKPGSYMRLPL